MSKLTDIFSLVACLPNAPEKDFQNGVRQHAIASLAELEQIKPGTRNAYLLRLARRARHHQTTVTKVDRRLGALQAIKLTPTNENLVRDFHHNVYYAGFFVARFALVSVGLFDCNQHRDIGKIVRDLIPPRDSARAQDAASLSVKLSEWQEERNSADYIMNLRRLNANPQVLRQRTQDLVAVFNTWNVPA